MGGWSSLVRLPQYARLARRSGIEAPYPHPKSNDGLGPEGVVILFFTFRQLSSAMRMNSEREPERVLIKDSELGRFLGDADCQVLATVTEVRELADGEILVREGDEDYTLFIVVSGVLKVSTKVNGRRRVVNTMKAGDCAGVRCFVERTPRQVTLQAKGPTVVYAIRPDDFELLIDSHPREVYHFMRGLFRMLNINLTRMHEKLHRLAQATH